MSVKLGHSVTKFKFWVDVHALYTRYRKAYNNFQNILVKITENFSDNKIILLPKSSVLAWYW